MTTASGAVRSSTHERLAEFAAIAAVVIALALGWVLKTSVEGRRVPFQGEGISAQVPEGWLRAVGQRGEILRVVNPASAGFPTMYAINVQPTAPETTPAEAASLLTLQRGQQLTAYRLLEQSPVTVNGHSAYRIAYAYVEVDANVTHADLPVVVQAEDFVFVQDGRSIVVSFRAAAAAYAEEYEWFPPFLASVQF
jgi:hypothetical protein